MSIFWRPPVYIYIYIYLLTLIQSMWYATFLYAALTAEVVEYADSQGVRPHSPTPTKLPVGCGWRPVILGNVILVTVVRDPATEVIAWFSILYFGPDLIWRTVGGARFDQSVGQIKFQHQCNCPDRILQIAFVENKYLNLLYLNGAKRRWLRLNCAERAILETI